MNYVLYRNPESTNPKHAQFMIAGIFGDFQLLFQRPVAGAPPAHFRALSTWAELHVSRHHDPRQSGAGQRAVASEHLHIQPQNIQSGGSAVQTCGSLDYHQQRRILLSSHSHHFYLSNALRRLSTWHTGMFRCTILATFMNTKLMKLLMDPRVCIMFINLPVKMSQKSIQVAFANVNPKPVPWEHSLSTKGKVTLHFMVRSKEFPLWHSFPSRQINIFDMTCSGLPKWKVSHFSNENTVVLFTYSYSDASFKWDLILTTTRKWSFWRVLVSKATWRRHDP